MATEGSDVELSDGAGQLIFDLINAGLEKNDNEIAKR
jgi:hypothetical protein